MVNEFIDRFVRTAFGSWPNLNRIFYVLKRDPGRETHHAAEKISGIAAPSRPRTERIVSLLAVDFLTSAPALGSTWS